MRFDVFLLAIILIFPWSAAAQNEPDHIDILLDVDWTISYTINPQRQPRQAQDAKWEAQNAKAQQALLNFGGDLYRITDFLPEVVFALKTFIPNLRLTIFSAGEPARNYYVISRIILPNNKSLAETADFLFSVDSMTDVKNPISQHFTDRKRKDASKLIPGFNPKTSLLIDDIEKFAPEGQTVISSFGRYDFQTRYRPIGDSGYAPPTERHWRNERAKALLWLGIIMTAYERYHAGEGDFSTLARQISVDPLTGSSLDLADPRVDHLINKGRSYVMRAMLLQKVLTKTVPVCWAI